MNLAVLHDVELVVRLAKVTLDPSSEDNAKALAKEILERYGAERELTKLDPPPIHWSTEGKPPPPLPLEVPPELAGEVSSCPKCGRTGTVEKWFGVVRKRGVIRKQSWCRPCRNRTNYYGEPRKYGPPEPIEK